MKLKSIFILLGLSILTACATPPPVKAGKDIGTIAISVNLYAPLAIMGGKTPDIIYFLKVDDTTKLTKSTELFPSNYIKKDRVYFFNAKPGNYVAVAGFYKNDGLGKTASSSSSVGKSGTVTVSVTPGPTDYITFFSEEVAKSTLIKVENGKIAYVGKLDVDMSLKLENADALQKHVTNLIKPGALEVSTGMAMLKGSYNYLGSLKKFTNDENTQKEFKETARQNELKESTWLEDLK
jgi:hypothetical protein